MIIEIPVTEVPVHGGAPSEWDADQWRSEDVIVTQSRYGRGQLRFGVGYIGAAGQFRRYHGGPVVTGEPYAFLFPLPVVISAYSTGTAGTEHVIATGEAVSIGGHVWRITDDRPHAYPCLALTED